MIQDRVVLGLAVAGAILGAGYFGGHFSAHIASAHSATSATKDGSPDDVVSAFYRAINARRYADAYAMMSSSFRSRASLARFSKGYQTTRRVSVDVEGTSGRIVAATVHAADERADGTLRERTFRGHWNLINESDKWRLSEGTFSTIADSGSQDANAAVVADAEKPDLSSAPAGCRQPTEDELLSDLGTLADDSALREFERKASALDDGAWKRIDDRYVISHGPLSGFDTLFRDLIPSCRLHEFVQKGVTFNILSDPRFSVNSFSAFGLAQIAVEARGVADPALVAELYAPFEPEIPLESIHGQYHPMHWPPD